MKNELIGFYFLGRESRCAQMSRNAKYLIVLSLLNLAFQLHAQDLNEESTRGRSRYQWRLRAIGENGRTLGRPRISARTRICRDLLNSATVEDRFCLALYPDVFDWREVPTSRGNELSCMNLTIDRPAEVSQCPLRTADQECDEASTPTTTPAVRGLLQLFQRITPDLGATSPRP